MCSSIFVIVLWHCGSRNSRIVVGGVLVVETNERREGKEKSIKQLNSHIITVSSLINSA